MDKKTSRHFAEIIELAESVFENVTHEIDDTPDRAILRIEAEYGKYQILVMELFSDNLRKYRYYVLRGEWVEAGFDNAPDPRAQIEIWQDRGRTQGREHPAFASGGQNTFVSDGRNVFCRFCAVVEK